MPEQFTRFGPLYTTTYAFLVGLAILLSIAYVTIRYRLRYPHRISAVLDVCLAALVTGLIVARIFHVLLNWTYFDLHRDEITQIDAGGLNWHGAVFGVLIAIVIVGRLRALNVRYLLATLAPLLPFIGLMAWWGCGANHCSYGAEVDNLSNYHDWLVWERRDIYNIVAPRYAVQRLGMILSAGMLLPFIIGYGWRWGRFWWDGYARHQPRDTSWAFWLTLIVFSAGMFWLGSMRGDYLTVAGVPLVADIAGLRADQWLDLCMLAAGFVFLVWERRRS